MLPDLKDKGSKFGKQLYEAVKFYEDYEDGKGESSKFIERFNRGFDFSLPVPSDFGIRDGTTGTKEYLNSLSKGFLKFRFQYRPVSSQRYRDKSSAYVYYVLHDEGGDVLTVPGRSDSMFVGYPDWNATEASFRDKFKTGQFLPFPGILFFRDFHKDLAILHNTYLLKQNEALKRMALDVGNDAHIRPELYYPFWGVKQGPEMSKDEFGTFANRYNKNIDTISNIIKTLTSGRQISSDEADGLYRTLDSVPIITESEIEGKVHGSVFIGVGRRMNNARVMRLQAKNELIKIMGLNKPNLEPIVMSNAKRIAALEQELPAILKRKDEFDRFTISNVSEMDAFRRDLQEMDAQNVQNNLKIREELEKIKTDGNGKLAGELSEISSIQKMHESDLSKLRGLDKEVGKINRLRTDLNDIKRENQERKELLNRTQVDEDRKFENNLSIFSRIENRLYNEKTKLIRFLEVFEKLKASHGSYLDAEELYSVAKKYVETGGVAGLKRTLEKLPEPLKVSSKVSLEEKYGILQNVLYLKKEEKEGKQKQKSIFELSPENDIELIKGIKEGRYFPNPRLLMNSKVYEEWFFLAKKVGAIIKIGDVLKVAPKGLPKDLNEIPSGAYIATKKLPRKIVKDLVEKRVVPSEYFKDGAFDYGALDNVPSWFVGYRQKFNKELSEIQEENKKIDKDFIDSFSVYKEEKKKETKELRDKVNEIELKTNADQKENRDALLKASNQLSNLELALKGIAQQSKDVNQSVLGMQGRLDKTEDLESQIGKIEFALKEVKQEAQKGREGLKKETGQQILELGKKVTDFQVGLEKSKVSNETYQKLANKVSDIGGELKTLTSTVSNGLQGNDSEIGKLKTKLATQGELLGFIQGRLDKTVDFETQLNNIETALKRAKDDVTQSGNKIKAELGEKIIGLGNVVQVIQAKLEKSELLPEAYQRLSERVEDTVTSFKTLSGSVVGKVEGTNKRIAELEKNLKTQMLMLDGMQSQLSGLNKTSDFVGKLETLGSQFEDLKKKTEAGFFTAEKVTQLTESNEKLTLDLLRLRQAFTQNKQLSDEGQQKVLNALGDLTTKVAGYQTKTADTFRSLSQGLEKKIGSVRERVAALNVDQEQLYKGLAGNTEDLIGILGDVEALQKTESELRKKQEAGFLSLKNDLSAEKKATRQLYNLYQNSAAKRPTGVTERRNKPKAHDAAKRFLNNYFSQMFKFYAY